MTMSPAIFMGFTLRWKQLWNFDEWSEKWRSLGVGMRSGQAVRVGTK
jgi:hypothetical protein